MCLFGQRQASVTQAITVKGRRVPAGVTRYETTEVNGQPVYGGANDPRLLGNLNDKLSDPGYYFGHLDLAKPV